MTYSAPEIHYVEYCIRLAKSNLVPDAARQHYQKLLTPHLLDANPSAIYGKPIAIYDNPSDGYYTAWKILTPAEQEAAEVFTLGKTLWCIFEGCAGPRISTLKAFRYDSSQEFPEFRRTPERMRRLILDCVKGNRDGEGGRIEVFRIGDKAFSRGYHGMPESPGDEARMTMHAAREMWKARISDMENFLNAKLRWRKGEATDNDKQLLGFMLRPSLDEILEVIKREELVLGADERKAIFHK